MTDIKPIKIIFWGTSDFALPSLQSLIESGYLISAVVTNPDKPVGRKKILTSSPVKILAQKYSILVLQPHSLSDYQLPASPAGRPATSYDLFIVAAYGKIIPKKLLNIPKYGAINIHPSLLPRWRGPSPIQYTILNGDRETGITIIKMDEKMDRGHVVAISNFQFPISKIKYQELHDKLAKLGAKLLIEILPKYLAREIKPVPQNESKATYSKILTKEGGKINWAKPAEEIERQIRAFDPWPGSWTKAKYKDRELRIVIENAAVFGQNSNNPAGFLWQSGKNLYVQTGNAILMLKQLKIEGRTSLRDAEFLRGYAHLLNQILK